MHLNFLPHNLCFLVSDLVDRNAIRRSHIEDVCARNKSSMSLAQ